VKNIPINQKPKTNATNINIPMTFEKNLIKLVLPIKGIKN